MKRMLMVPIHLDALCLKENAYGVAPFVSHELQTYFNAATAQDEHGDRPFLGAALESPPFSDSLQVLGSGVHLHWALPDGLANANHKKGSKPDGSEDDIEFLPVPNRWLVVRSEKDGDIWKHTSKFWVIESDFVSETSETTGNGLQSVSYPTPLSTTNATPFRFLGRKNETDSEWKEETDPKNYLPSLGPRLTVTGWGDPSFAAFYPGCYGVFGLYDETPAKANTRYDVFGWYGTPSDDPFLKFAARFDGMQDQELRHFLNMHVREPNAQVAGQIPQRTDYLPEKSDSTPPLSGLDLSDAFLLYMQEQFGWTVEGVDATHPLQTKLSAGAQFDGTLCYSRITLNVDTQNQHLPVRQFSGSPVVAVGNTGAEALASRLGDLMVPGVTAPDGQRSQDRQNIEELLLAMDLAPMLSGQDLDLGAKFKQARHARGFRAVTSGAAWSIRPAVDPNASASAPASAKQQTDMPTELATQLDELNRAQSALDQINGQINTLRQQLFNDWNRYLGACYPGFEEFSLDSVNSDRVARIKDYMINDPKNGAAAIDSKIRERGVAQFVRHDNGQWELKGGDEQFETADGRLVPSIANRLKTALTATSNSLAQFNAVRRAANLGEFVLQQGPGARFYEPNEPVVLLSGDPIATPSPKHGRDAVSEPGGNLRCQLVELSNFTPGGANFPLAEELIRKVASVTGQEGRVGFKVGSENPWNPLLME